MYWQYFVNGYVGNAKMQGGSFKMAPVIKEVT